MRDRPSDMPDGAITPHTCTPTRRQACKACGNGSHKLLGFSFSMAFQPIVDIRTNGIYAHEALVRGPAGEGAAHILGQVTDSNRYVFDQACRLHAIRMAGDHGLDCRLSINFLPNAVYEPASCISATVAEARRRRFPLDRIIFEITESEKVVDHAHLARIVREYKSQGMLTAIDDFGAGWSGLNLLADLHPDLIKLDMALTRNIHADRVRRTIVAATLQVARELDIGVIAEGIESEAEFDTLADMGVPLFQGYLFARPAFERLLAPADIRFPARSPLPPTAS